VSGCSCNDVDIESHLVAGIDPMSKETILKAFFLSG
jgi:hypothetical protein